MELEEKKVEITTKKLMTYKEDAIHQLQTIKNNQFRLKVLKWFGFGIFLVGLYHHYEEGSIVMSILGALIVLGCYIQPGNGESNSTEIEIDAFAQYLKDVDTRHLQKKSE